MSREKMLTIRPGDYVYTGELPKGCAGHVYRVHGFVLDVPSYQEKVLVEALTGKDKGVWFTCSLANFATRYRPCDVAPSAPAPEKEIGWISQGSGA